MKKVLMLGLLSVLSLSLYSSDNDYSKRTELIKKGKNIICTEYLDTKANFSQTAGNRSVTASYEKDNKQRNLEITLYDTEKNVLLAFFKCHRTVIGKPHDTILPLEDQNFSSELFGPIVSMFLEGSDSFLSLGISQSTNTANRQDTVYFGNTEPKKN